MGNHQILPLGFEGLWQTENIALMFLPLLRKSDPTLSLCAKGFVGLSHHVIPAVILSLQEPDSSE